MQQCSLLQSSRGEDTIFSLIKVLTAGMEFPDNFGFVPFTKAEDGDPPGTLVLMNQPADPGCRLTCRPIGVIEDEQNSKKDTERVSRFPGSSFGCRCWAHALGVRP